MIRTPTRYVALMVMGGLLAYGGYRLSGNAPSKAVASEQAMKDHGKPDDHGDGIKLSDAKVTAAEIELVKAMPQILRDSFLLNGIVQSNQESLVQVTPRFPGVVRDIRKRIGDKVDKGEVLAVVESNQSLTPYELKASLGGTIIDRQISLGEYVSEQKSAFVISDLSTVWIDFAVYRSDLKRVKIGDAVAIDAADGGAPIAATVAYLSPIGSSDTQTALARAVVSNKERRLRPGLFVTARLTISDKQVGVAVKASALQTVDNRTVVFVRDGATFAPRAVAVGDSDAQFVEIMSGIAVGETYAADNSFIVKAEMAKGSSEHAH